MNELQVFTNDQFGEVRVIRKDAEPRPVRARVCRVLGLSDPNKTAEQLDPDEPTRTKIVLGGPGRQAPRLPWVC